MIDRVRTILLLAAVFLLCASPAVAQKKSLKQLTAEDVQGASSSFSPARGRRSSWRR